MANRKVKCPYCQEQLPRGQAIRHTNNRYYHPECYEIATQDARHYKELIETICRIWGIDAPTGAMVRQIKNYKQDPELQFTNKGIELTLIYYYDLLENKPLETEGIGIVPIYYREAEKHYLHLQEIEEKAKELANEEKEVREVTLKKIDYYIKNRKKENGLIDLTKL